MNENLINRLPFDFCEFDLALLSLLGDNIETKENIKNWNIKIIKNFFQILLNNPTCIIESDRYKIHSLSLKFGKLKFTHEFWNEENLLKEINFLEQTKKFNY